MFFEKLAENKIRTHFSRRRSSHRYHLLSSDALTSKKLQMSTDQHYSCARSVLRVRRSLPLNYEFIKYNVIITLFFYSGGLQRRFLMSFQSIFSKIIYSDVVVHQFHITKWKKKFNHIFFPSVVQYAFIRRPVPNQFRWLKWFIYFFFGRFFILFRNGIKCEVVRQYIDEMHMRFWNELSLLFNGEERYSDGGRKREWWYTNACINK